MAKIRGWAAKAAKRPLVPFEYDPGPLGPDDVEVAIEFCGVCHSDVSVLNNEWGMSQYPRVLGHEAVGKVVALGTQAKGLKVGQRVGIGWTAESCMYCQQCLGGDQHLCLKAKPTILAHQGGFAERMRAHWAWTIPLPDDIDMSSTGPLLCGGVTVFAPLAVFNVQPTAHVGVVGIGGLGHMGIKFARAWGCEVTAFTSTESKGAEAKAFGAHHIASSRDPKKAAGTLDFLLITATANLDWSAYLSALKPNGRMHVVAGLTEPMGIPAFPLILGQKRISGSPTGSPTRLASMLEFAARHKVAPTVEHFPMSKVNEAIAHLEAGKARYRIVLDADWK